MLYGDAGMMDDVALELSNSLDYIKEVNAAFSNTVRLMRSAEDAHLVSDGSAAGKLYKAGLSLILFVPVPIASEAAGSILLALGKILSERSKKPVELRLDELMDATLKAAEDIHYSS